MSFGVYVHIPYCIQRCHYCDFTTFEQSQIIPPAAYLDLLLKEVELRSSAAPKQSLKSLYFGGGTPSLFPPELLKSLIQRLNDKGLSLAPSTEVTIEINPATISEKKIAAYLEMGINRFSVGAQTFSDSLLKTCGREHDSNDTRKTLELLQSFQLNYSVDLLFGLPKQTAEMLHYDIDQILSYSPSHISPYCLTLPSGHFLNQNRPPEAHQIEMFQIIEDRLSERNFTGYEISNYALPNRESVHNLLYWQSESYWGLGLSAHSHLRNSSWGLRFWNPKKMEDYSRQVEINMDSGFESVLPEAQYESLHEHEALTDFCHTSMRLRVGLSRDALRQRFAESASLAENRLETLVNTGWVDRTDGGWRLSSHGRLVSNRVFLELTFLIDDLKTGI